MKELDNKELEMVADDSRKNQPQYETRTDISTDSGSAAKDTEAISAPHHHEKRSDRSENFYKPRKNSSTRKKNDSQQAQHENVVAAQSQPNLF